MLPSINYQLKERLQSRYEWLSYYQSILDHMNITDDVYFLFHKNNIFLFILLELINLPSIIYRVIRKIKIKNNIRFLKLEIVYLETITKKN